MTYRLIEMPPQTATQAYVCDVCSAIVVDPLLHTESHALAPVEPRRQSRVPNAELEAVKL